MVHSPGLSSQTSMVTHGVVINFGYNLFLPSFIPLKSTDIDVILVMDWLAKHHANIDCAARSIIMTSPAGRTFIYSSPSSIPPSAVSISEANFYDIDVLQLLEIHDVPVVWDFPDVFSEELPSMPPDRDVEFVIELVPGTAHVSKRPYRMPPEELVELKKQIEELENKGFIQHSTSSWGCPRLFIKKRDTNVP
jgi:hypothetical protein